MNRIFVIIGLFLAALTAVGVAADFDMQVQNETDNFYYEVLSGDSEKLLRLRIKANSDSAFDQAVKLAVRDELCARFEALFCEVDSKAEAVKKVKIDELRRAANEVLSRYGCAYRAEVAVLRQNFPEKTYGGVTLSSGEYDALVITLGRGGGANWWCVAYPPLCFIGGTPNRDNPSEITYRSIILEWIFNSRNR